MYDFISKLPKIELHLHIEGTLEPRMMFDLAQKNRVKIPYDSAKEIANAYAFKDLQSFLDIYYAGASVLREEEDFFELTWAYLLKCKEENILHTEIFFDPQTHTMRGIPMAEIIGGITAALKKGREELGISSYLIACILRHLSQEEGLETLRDLLNFKDQIVGIGLDSSERGNPASKFAELFARAKNEGFLLVAHAGEEGSSDFIWDALEMGASRIDHGVRCEEDPLLVERLREEKIPLTMCPLSNLALKVTPKLEEHNAIRLLNQGLCVTINSDDPAYFGGYMNANFQATAQALKAGKKELWSLSCNALEASFLSQDLKGRYRKILDDFWQSHDI